MLRFLKMMGNGFVTLMNITTMGILVAFAAYATGTTIISGDEQVHDNSVEIVIPVQVDPNQRIDMEYFLIDPYKFEQEFCLAQNIFFESSVDNKAGMAAVADVVLNRVKHSYYPNTICEVVYQAKMKESWKTKQFPDLDDSERKYIPIRHRCQFSWYCDGKSDDIPLGSENWVKAQMIAWDIMHNEGLRGITEGATHYHATYVKPNWASQHNMDLVGRIGLHIFYRWN